MEKPVGSFRRASFAPAADTTFFAPGTLKSGMEARLESG
jgi:hypothetical protein